MTHATSLSAIIPKSAYAVLSLPFVSFDPLEIRPKQNEELGWREEKDETEIK